MSGWGRILQTTHSFSCLPQWGLGVHHAGGQQLSPGSAETLGKLFHFSEPQLSSEVKTSQDCQELHKIKSYAK